MSTFPQWMIWVVFTLLMGGIFWGIWSSVQKHRRFKTSLFLDDERFPPIDQRRWVIVRSFEDAVRHVEKRGCPGYISFDNDLGGKKEGFDFARWLIDRDLDMGFKCIPPHFHFYVHSQNPVAARRINELLNSYLYHRFEEHQKRQKVYGKRSN